VVIASFQSGADIDIHLINQQIITLQLQRAAQAEWQGIRK
jgi:hypothetical protein